MKNVNRPPVRSAVFPCYSSKWDIVVASVFLVITASSLISAKTMAFTCALFVGLYLATHAARGTLSLDLFRPSATTILIAGFLLLASASMLWAAEPMLALPKLAIVVSACLTLVIAARLMRSEMPPKTARLAESLWIGLLIGLCYLVVRHLTDGEMDSVLLPTFAHQLVKLGAGEITRSTAPVTLLIGPALLALEGGINKPWRTLFASTIVVTAVLAIVTSPHETSKLALAAAAVVLGLAYLRDRWAYRLLQLGWLAACLLMVPAAMFAKSQDLHNASWLQSTAQQRILIWEEFAVRTLEAPLLGHGFDMAAVIKPTIAGLSELPYVRAGKEIPKAVKPFRAIHPHNAYLQVWFEMGAIGAGLMLVAGLAILAGFAQLQTHQRPWMYATAAAAAVMLFSSYGLWQLWFVGMLAFTAIACSVAIKVSSGLPQPGDALSSDGCKAASPTC
jgi:O-antigen ligase